jgi:cobalamin synthase
MGAIALWALAGLLPVYTGDHDRNLARSLRRRFALVGLLVGVTLVGTLWEWTANLAVVGGASVVIVVLLWLYSEHGDRPAA